MYSKASDLVVHVPIFTKKEAILKIEPSFVKSVLLDAAAAKTGRQV